MFYKLPFFSQVFRFPFTKLSILYIFNLSLFFGLGLLFITEALRFNKNRNLFILLISILPIIYCFPIFSGKLFYYKVRTDIPKEYYDLFDFFRNRPKNERIANFPQYTFWGWTFYRWNYSGSGFLWYGIEQPILDRAFDVWSMEDENYYHEISYAIYSHDLPFFEKILRKYQTSWILFDGNVISYSNSRELYSDRLESLLENSTSIRKFKQFGKISLYKVMLPEDKNVKFSSIIPLILPAYKSNNYDRAYYEYGDYFSSSTDSLPINKIDSSSSIYYPFRSLFTGRAQKDLEFKVEDNEQEFIFKTDIPVEFSGSTLYLPQFERQDIQELDQNDFTKSIDKYPQIFLDGEKIQFNSTLDDKNLVNLPYIKKGNLEIKIPKITGHYSYSNDNSEEFDRHVPFPCDKANPVDNTSEKIMLYGNRFIRLNSIDGIYCLNYNLQHLSHNLAYLVSIENRNLQGKSLYLSIINNNSSRADHESYFPLLNKQDLNINKSYFIIPPMESFAKGYLLSFKNISIGRTKSINDLGKITVNAFPYRFLTGIKIIKPSKNDSNNIISSISSYTVNKFSPGYYRINFEMNNLKFPMSNMMVLSQSYDPGWKAYISTCLKSTLICTIKNFFPFTFYNELNDHVLINNWENGWVIDSDKINQAKSFIIIYKPQYLEYLGFAMWLLLPLIFLIVPNKTSFSD